MKHDVADHPRRAVLLAVFAYAASVTAANVIPHEVLAFSTLQRLDEAQIGFLAMCEAMTLALVSMFAAAFGVRWARLAGIAGAFLVAAAQLASIAAPGFDSLVVLRTSVGAGCGLAAALAVRVISQSALAGPAFGWANGVSAVLGAAFMAGVPQFPSESPGIRVFVPLAVLAALLGLSALGSSRHLVDSPAGVAAVDALKARGANAASGAALIVATLFIYLPLGALWTFSVQLGTHVGMSERETGSILGWVLLGGFVGGLLAAWTHVRMPPVPSMVLGCALSAAACLAVGTVGGAWSFGFAFLIYAIAYMFAISVIQALGSTVDPSGGLPAVLFGVLLIGYAIGSYLAGYLLTIGQSPLIWQVGAVTCAAAAAPAIWVVRRSRA